MFGTIRRHQTWLWVVVATVTIVTFIIAFNPATRSGGRGSRVSDESHGTINGQPVSDQEYQDAQREVLIHFRLNNQKVDPNSLELQFVTYQNLFLINKEEELGIKVTPEAASTFARSHYIGKGNPQDFIKQYGLDASDFDRYLRHQVALQQLMTITGIGGSLVLPAEADTLFRAQNREVATSMVYFSYTNYLSQVTNSAADLIQFYANNATNYAIPEKVAVNYVKFYASNYLADVKAMATNLDDLVNRVYDQNGTNLPPGVKTPEEAKAKIRDEILLVNTRRKAELAANAFAEQLDQAGAHADTFAAIAKTNGLTVQTTEPFDLSGPDGLKVPPTFAEQALHLNNDMPFTGSITAEDGAYVLGFKQRIPSTIPPLHDFEAKVSADLRELKARQLALDAASKFSQAVTDELGVKNDVTLPKDFKTIADDNDQKVETLPPLALSATNTTPDLENRIGLNLLKRVAFGTPPGAASAANNAPEGAFILYVDKILPIDNTKSSSELPNFLSYLRSVRENEAFQEWMNTEINRDSGLVATLTALQKAQAGPDAASPKK